MGRPPTSGYCHTCRKRRIKCDRTKPGCLRCLKSGYACKGYDLGLRMQSFVVVTEAEGAQRLAKVILKDETTSSDHRQLTRQHSEEDSDSSSSSAHGSPGPEMPLTAFQENLAFSYFFATYGWANFWKPFMQLARETDLASTSRTCSLALAYGHMGVSYGERGLKSMGLELYGQSLREVQLLIANHDATVKGKADLARLCVPIVLLGMYSFAVDKDLRLIHNAGVIQILQHCGPESFTDEPLLTAFRSCRALLICQSFALRRRTFLEDVKWRTIPWSKLAKTKLDSVFDILSQIPGVVYDMAASEHPISPATKAGFKLRVRTLKNDLEQWRWDWEAKHPSAVTLVPSRLDLSAVETPVFRDILATMLDFDTVQQALEMLTYNAGLIYLMQLQDILQMGEPHNVDLSPEVMDEIRSMSTKQSESPLLLPGDAKYICQAALEAFRLVPLLYARLATGKDRLMVVLAPIGIVYCALQAHPELSRCMKFVLNDIPVFNFGQGALQVYELALGKAWSPSVASAVLSECLPTVTAPDNELAAGL